MARAATIHIIMNTLVSSPAHFVQTPDGHLWTPNAAMCYPFWTRYLYAYDEVRLLAQAKPQAEPPDGWGQVTGPNVIAAAIPDFLTPRLYVQNLRKVRSLIRAALEQTDAVLLRVPCFVGKEIWSCLEANRPFGAEVVADPYDVFAPGSVRHPLRPLLRITTPRNLRRQCLTACAATYVTKNALQRRYPVAPGALSTYYSDVDLTGAAFADAPRISPVDRAYRLVFVGTFAQLYKAPDVLIRAVAICLQKGIDLNLTLIGEGRHLDEMKALVQELGMTERVTFLGYFSSRDGVQKELDKADLFVLPSHQEGLPRAMVEAMARALPCVGSTVGGIPELLPAEDLVPPGNVDALAEKLQAVLTDPERMAQMSKRNLETAHEYEEGVLRERREAFYQYVHDKTAEWLMKNPVKNQN